MCVSVCQVCAWRKAHRAHTRRLFPPENSPVDNEILTETPSVRLSTRTLDEFHRNSSEIRAIGPALWGAVWGYCCPACLSVYCYYYFILKSAANVPGKSPQWNVRTSVMRGASAPPLIDRHIQLPLRPLLYSTPPQASPWQSEPTCQSAALIVRRGGARFYVTRRVRVAAICKTRLDRCLSLRVLFCRWRMF